MENSVKTLSLTEQHLLCQMEEFLSRFSEQATSWNDEIMDVARSVRMSYNEVVLDVVEGEEGYINAIDFRSFKRPGAFNEAYKTQIRALWCELPVYEQERIVNELPTL